MDNGEGQPRPEGVFGFGLERLLREAGDPDLWLEAENLAMRAWLTVGRRRANAAEPHEDGQGHEN